MVYGSTARPFEFRTNAFRVAYVSNDTAAEGPSIERPLVCEENFVLYIGGIDASPRLKQAAQSVFEGAMFI